MQRQVQFVTPENIEISYELSGIGSRFLAGSIDLSIQLLVVLFLSLVGGLITQGSALFSNVIAGSISLWLYAVMGLISFTILFGYHTFFEMRWGGRTPGKRLVGLRVVRDGGYPIDLYSSMTRNLVRIVDFLPPVYSAGLFSIFFSSEYKRLGDFAAGTIVIKERKPGFLGGRKHGPPTQIVAYYMNQVKNLEMLEAEEFHAIRRFVARRNELAVPIQAQLGMRLAQPIIEKLKLEVPIMVPWNYADLLEAIERRYMDERGLIE
jgi:uncharacterized RDD family membrane protein YckC